MRWQTWASASSYGSTNTLVLRILISFCEQVDKAAIRVVDAICLGSFREEARTLTRTETSGAALATFEGQFGFVFLFLYIFLPWSLTGLSLSCPVLWPSRRGPASRGGSEELHICSYLWFVCFGIALHVLHGCQGFKSTHHSAPTTTQHQPAVDNNEPTTPIRESKTTLVFQSLDTPPAFCYFIFTTFYTAHEDPEDVKYTRKRNNWMKQRKTLSATVNTLSMKAVYCEGFKYMLCFCSFPLLLFDSSFHVCSNVP